MVSCSSEVEGELRARDGAGSSSEECGLHEGTPQHNYQPVRSDKLRYCRRWRAAASAVVLERAAAKPVDLTDERKARYLASSMEVRDFYRVNSYPAR
jgi:hypothetical protein